MLPSSSTPQLAPDYYLANFWRLLDHACQWYEDLLTQEERNWIETFKKLPHSSQCIIVRLLSRKGEWFRSDKLDYAEIANLEAQWPILEASGFIQMNPNLTEAQLCELLFTKPEIIARHPLLNKTLRKDDLLAAIEQDTPAQPTPFTIIHLVHNDIIELLLILFFANAHQDLSQFVLDDLGLHRFEQYQLSQTQRFFHHRDEIEQLRLLQRIAQDYWQDEKQPKDALVRLCQQLPDKASHPYVERKRQKLINQLARALERLEESELALHYFAQSSLPPSRERQARIYDKLGQYQRMGYLIEQIKDTPYHQEELEIAQRLQQRYLRTQGQKVPRATKPKWPERHLSLDLSTQRVELAVRDELITQGYHVYYLENQLLNTLLALVLWPAIFAPVEGAFVNAYQARPLDFYHAEFCAKRQPLIDECFAYFIEHGALALIERWQEKQGIANPLTSWQGIDEALFHWIDRTIPRATLVALMKIQLKDLRLFRAGMPDLMAFKEETYEWIEVKGPGDKLQDNQLRWMSEFAKLDIPFSVCYVNH